jgi:surfactin synthase thioesterase subunit
MGFIKLFSFPYAGGSSASFNKWKQYLHPSIELVPVELAGRGRRMRDPFYRNVPELVEDVFHIIRSEISKGPYALFGHSMGSMIAYHLAQRIREAQLPGPVHAFFSGRGVPHLKRNDEKLYHLMNDSDFKKEVIELGGTPPEFFQYPELMELLLPLLKNDFRLAETVVEEGAIRPLNESITVFLGKDEDLTPEQCDGWKAHTEKICNIHYFPGGHFFLQEETESIIELINNTLVANGYAVN